MQIRTKKPALFKYVPVPIDEIRTYEGLNDYPTLTTLPMYTRHQITAPVTYLGRDAHEAYFKFRGLVYRYAGPTHIGQVAALVGYRFHLKDRGYAQLGFIDPKHLQQHSSSLEHKRASSIRQQTKWSSRLIKWGANGQRKRSIMDDLLRGFSEHVDDVAILV